MLDMLSISLFDINMGLSNDHAFNLHLQPVTQCWKLHSIVLLQYDCHSLELCMPLHLCLYSVKSLGTHSVLKNPIVVLKTMYTCMQYIFQWIKLRFCHLV